VSCYKVGFFVRETTMFCIFAFKLILMNKITLFFLLFTQFVFSQSTSSRLPDSLISLYEGANSVVKENDCRVTIHSQKSFTLKSRRVVLVLNEKGLRNLDVSVHYDKTVKVKNIEAKLYNALGKEMKTFRKKDFRDVSVADGFSVFTDSRMIYLDFTPVQYPFILEFIHETESGNTAFIPTWYPLRNSYESVMKDTYSISYPSDLGFRYKEFNLDGFDVNKTDLPNNLTLAAKNLSALKQEDMAPVFSSLVPRVHFSLTNFSLEGISGSAENWKEFGAWVNSSLLKGLDKLSEETKSNIKKVVASETDPIEKAKLVYKYVQNKTRYVSIQLGIGGWRPMPAEDVDRLGYGDCKALTNYTKALLDVVGVTSYYTIIYGDSNKRDLLHDFVSLQGNHVILTIPNGTENYFLECTSQAGPFGFEGSFTDDRYALLVKPDGGEVVKTNSYLNETNEQKCKGSYFLDPSGTLIGRLERVSKGIQYEASYPLEKLSHERIVEFYKNHFTVLKKLEVKKYNFENNKDKKEFLEQLELKSISFAEITSDRILFPINAFNQYNEIPQRYRNRNLPFEFFRGFSDIDEYEISFPEGYAVESLPENVFFHEDFGHYKMSVEEKEKRIVYKREMLIKAGKYPKERYEEFRKFCEKIARAENSKAVFRKK